MAAEGGAQLMSGQLSVKSDVITRIFQKVRNRSKWLQLFQWNFVAARSFPEIRI